jgi:hypothetical protein
LLVEVHLKSLFQFASFIGAGLFTTNALPFLIRRQFSVALLAFVNLHDLFCVNLQDLMMLPSSCYACSPYRYRFTVFARPPPSSLLFWHGGCS